MDRQTEITTPGALLNEKGDLARPGFPARSCRNTAART